MSNSHFPHRGDKVNDKRRVPYANGFIIRIVYDDGPSEIMVRFDNGVETYDFEDFRNRWTDSYGGTFELVTPGSSKEDIELLLKLVFNT